MGKVAHLRVAVLNLTASGGNHTHGFGAEFLKLAVGHRDVVAVLVLGHIVLLLGGDGVVFKLTHHLELHAAGGLAEGAVGLLQGVFRSHSEGLAILGVERAEQVERRHLGEGVDEGCAETRDDVKVRVARLDVGEQARAVDALATSEHLVGVRQRLNDEVKRMQLAVIRHVAEVDHLDLEFLDDLEDIGLGELCHGFLQKRHQGVGIELELFLCHDYLYLLKSPMVTQRLSFYCMKYKKNFPRGSKNEKGLPIEGNPLVSVNG